MRARTMTETGPQSPASALPAAAVEIIEKGLRRRPRAEELAPFAEWWTETLARFEGLKRWLLPRLVHEQASYLRDGLRGVYAQLDELVAVLPAEVRRTNAVSSRLWSALARVEDLQVWSETHEVRAQGAGAETAPVSGLAALRALWLTEEGEGVRLGLLKIELPFLTAVRLAALAANSVMPGSVTDDAVRQKLVLLRKPREHDAPPSGQPPV